MSTTSLEGKTALITGAASGIGKATAHKLDSLGATLILCDINEQSLQELQSALSHRPRNNAKHIFQVCDVASSTDCTRLTQIVRSSLEHLNFLFNCAGINPTTIAITDTTEEYFSQLVDVNLRGTFNMCRACVPLMRRGSVMVNVSSVCGLKGVAGHSVYCATKFAVIGLTKALAVELGPQGIRVNAVAPGHTDTPTMVGNVAGGDANERIVKEIPLGRLGQPREVAEVVAFLFSEGAAYMSGSVVEVTGGVS
ncbi:SDR family NAD(P)-dependent oxidoreductase [Aspergillus saccharolyticus JOP 1030-1]|uniref:NAD(P)-binding protein n=1 Tax=Aspergillus saccharolyticus JOP 1030-1 TaxID=1450539 RepID=A0A318ZA96_9EURO|nr:NAD(P)-binding protein [Aspergillus saccharolyticus JOP 1030-1]PYH40410.1 NAD(P)-binding protein [Aspergillus saccharolyticus JOP 1030-1]